MNWSGPKFGAPHYPDTPSESSTIVFIVSTEEAQKAFGNIYPRTTPQEVICHGTVCGDVTTAVYITREELNNGDLLGRELSWSVGLIPEGETLPIELAPTEPVKDSGSPVPTATPFPFEDNQLPVLTTTPAYPAP